jgi:hypothetical protein
MGYTVAPSGLQASADGVEYADEARESSDHVTKSMMQTQWLKVKNPRS